MAKLRSILLTFTIEVVVVGVVLALLDLEVEDGVDTTSAVAGVALLGVASLAVGTRLRRLDPSSAVSLLTSYRQRFFHRIAAAEAVGLIGFVLAFLTGSIVTYLVALPFTLVGFALAAPTRSAIQRDQDALNATGTTVDLQAVLLT